MTPRFTGLCETLGRPDLAGDHRFATNEARTEHAVELGAEMEEAPLDRHRRRLAGPAGRGGHTLRADQRHRCGGGRSGSAGQEHDRGGGATGRLGPGDGGQPGEAAVSRRPRQVSGARCRVL